MVSFFKILSKNAIFERISLFQKYFLQENV